MSRELINFIRKNLDELTKTHEIISESIKQLKLSEFNAVLGLAEITMPENSTITVVEDSYYGNHGYGEDEKIIFCTTNEGDKTVVENYRPAHGDHSDNYNGLGKLCPNVQYFNIHYLEWSLFLEDYCDE